MVRSNFLAGGPSRTALDVNGGFCLSGCVFSGFEIGVIADESDANITILGCAFDACNYGAKIGPPNTLISKTSFRNYTLAIWIRQGVIPPSGGITEVSECVFNEKEWPAILFGGGLFVSACCFGARMLSIGVHSPGTVLLGEGNEFGAENLSCAVGAAVSDGSSSAVFGRLTGCSFEFEITPVATETSTKEQSASATKAATLSETGEATETSTKEQSASATKAATLSETSVPGGAVPMATVRPGPRQVSGGVTGAAVGGAGAGAAVLVVVLGAVICKKWKRQGEEEEEVVEV
jgi:hypothetical protein